MHERGHTRHGALDQLLAEGRGRPVARRRLAARWPLLVQLTWGLPQTLIGLVLFMALRRAGRHAWYRSALVSEWGLDAGLSLGAFIFVPQDCPRSLLVHEYGHSIQSLLLGPLYLVLVVMPSLVWAGVPRLQRFRSRTNYSYYRFAPERWANLLTRRVTGELPYGWYERPPRGRRGRRAS